MNRLTWLALTTLALTSCARGVQYPGAKTETALAAEIETLIEAADCEGVIAVHAELRSPTRVILSRHSDRAMTPASNNKLHTTASALHYLGAERTRTTRVLANGPIDETGALQGDLIVVGDGDPTISGRFSDGDVLATFRAWAQTLRDKHGVRSITGDIVGDDDLFDDQLIIDSWFLDELGEWYSAESSALSFNDNCVDLHWTAGPEVGAAPTFTLDPVTDYLEIVSRVETLAVDADTDRYYHREFESNHMEITGGIPLGETANDSAAVHNPTLYTVTVLRDVLESEGVAVAGAPRDIDDLDRAAVHHDLTELCATDSPPMSVIIDVINQRSQNLYADMVLKMIGVEAAGEGSFEAGARAVRDFLAEIGALPAEGAWRMLDGSGLSQSGLTTPRCLVTLLRHMDTRPDADVFRASLPRGRANRGSLRRRFGHSERHRAVAPQILGKTGYINGVWTLSGILTNQAGEDIHYSIMLNGYESPSVRATRMIDDIAVAIAASMIAE